MTILTADGSHLDWLRQANGPTEIRDPQGRLIGFYAPTAAEGVPEHLRPASEADLPELRRRQATEGRGVTTRELFEYLKSITPEPEWRDHLQQHIDRLAERERCDAP
jgi:hypothetical protein